MALFATAAATSSDASNATLTDANEDQFLDGDKSFWSEGRLYICEAVWRADRHLRRVFDGGEEALMLDVERKLFYVPDADGDGLRDFAEDRNRNGRFEILGADREPDTPDDETDWQDIDTDDDGLSDGFENGDSCGAAAAFFENGCHPLDPDSDDDGLPDGLEWGVVTPPLMPCSLVHGDGSPLGGTDRNAVYALGSGEARACFVPDLDPGSLTASGLADTNGDEVLDGAQDPNANGRCDAGESDAAAGYIGVSDLREICGQSAFARPWGYFDEANAYGLPGVGSAHRKPTSDRLGFTFGFQTADDESAPQVQVESTLLEVLCINRVQGSRIWLVGIAANKGVSITTPIMTSVGIATTSGQADHRIFIKLCP